MVITLKRFIWEGNRIYKDNSALTFPLELTMDYFMMKTSDNEESSNQLENLIEFGQEFKYSLYGMVIHYGSVEGGHYISCVLKDR